MQFDVHQFYPTPPELRDSAWKLFQNREFTTVLEPSAEEVKSPFNDETLTLEGD
ncbi:MAG: hypothetical protein ACTS9Y_01195 [Methylophilus sp.]|uniref:hypothetical protein n=1 Tax=Methylophilus sp. TaxID=29541 RepID=UPI003FA0E6BB